jgi:hypothetical protein
MAGNLRTFVPHAAVAAAFAVITAGAAVRAVQHPYSRPHDTFDRCVARYAAGTLTDDDGAKLCGQHVLLPAIVGAGRAHFTEIEAIYDHATELGKARIRDVMIAAYKTGRAAFSALPHAEQTRIKGASKQAFIRSGNADFNALTREERQTIEERSFYEYIAKEGFAHLGDADKAVVGDVSVLTDLAARTARAIVVGRDLLDPADKARLPNTTKQEFAAGRDAFIDTEGRRLIGSRLAASFKPSHPTLAIERYSGTVVAWSRATGAVQWHGVAGADATALLGSSVVFARKGNVWTMDWR